LIDGRRPQSPRKSGRRSAPKPASPPQLAKKAVEAVLAGIVNAAKKGEEVNLPGFGKFKVKDNPARQGRNPATGETIDIAASRKLGFSPAKQVKGALASRRAEMETRRGTLRYSATFPLTGYRS